ncbi:MAG: hypothetical protein JO016_05905 [Actinobacteria bacterium]|nr:hypothetical protein [Actinomycetota bacterium]
MPYGPSPTPRGLRSSRRSRAAEHRPDEPDAEEAGANVRVTVDLTPAEYQVLNVWLARASLQLDQPVDTMTVARGIRALIQAVGADNAVSDAVLFRLGRGSSQDEKAL